MKIYIKSKSVELTKTHYKGSGGEGTVYYKSGVGYKIYHDPKKKMIPPGKIAELASINLPNVLAPMDIIHDAQKHPIGFTMPYVDNIEYLCKLFVKGYRNKNNISPEMIVDLVTAMQKTLSEIHKKGFLVVDYNEMNFLVSRDYKIPYYIDTDSYKTPSFPPTALMESVRDRKSKKGVFNTGTDWFAWACVTFQLYMGTHPYKGRHDAYKPKDWLKMMDDGVSVFHPDVRLPANTQDWSVIPKPHLNWYRQVFLKDDRSVPPLADQLEIITVVTPVMIKGTDKFEVTLSETLSKPLRHAQYIDGVRYLVTDSEVIVGPKTYKYTPGAKIRFITVPGSSPVVATQTANAVLFRDMTGKEVGSLMAQGMMTANGYVYTVHNGKLTEHSCIALPSRVVHSLKIVCNIFEPAYQLFEGVVTQDIMGKCWIAIPYRQGKCANFHVPELDGYRIIDAKYESRFCIVIGERNGRYDRFTFCFDRDTVDHYTVRTDQDVSIDTVNFTVLPNGLCITVINDLRVEAFFSNDKVKTIDKPPFDSSMRLFCEGMAVYFMDQKKIYKIRLK